MAKSKTFPLLMLIKRDVHDLEYNPMVQYRFHRRMAFFWLTTMGAVLFVKPLHPNAPDLFIIETSLYANFSTEFGAMSSAIVGHQGQDFGKKVVKRQKRIEHTLTTVFDYPE